MNSSSISPLNIVILPDKKTVQKSLELSKKISEKIGTYFTLDNKNYYPHITIYQALYPAKNISLLKQKILHCVKHIQPFEITASKFSAIVNSWISWNILKTKQLMELELQILDLANPLREGLIPESLKGVSQAETDLQEIKKYGALLVKNRYTPHITVTRIKNPEDSEKTLNLIKDEKEYSFLVDKIYLGNLGEHGTVNKIFEEYPFGK